MEVPGKTGKIGVVSSIQEGQPHESMGIDERHIDELTARVIECIIHVHQILGPGFLEIVYRRALLIELRKRELSTETEREFVVYYDGQQVGRHRLDLLVEGQVILELKTVEALSRAHYAQVRSYLRATSLDVALLVNFGAHRADFRRVQGYSQRSSK